MPTSVGRASGCGHRIHTLYEDALRRGLTTPKRHTVKKALTVLLLIAALLVAYLLVWPVPVRAVVWPAATAPGYKGVHAPNTLLAGLQYIDLAGEEGPEHVQIGPDGLLYTTVASGKVLRMAPDGADLETHVHTGGRVLGFDFDRAGYLIAADAMRGLLRVDPKDTVQVLTDRWVDDPIRYADAVVVTREPSVPEQMFFTDASTRFGAREWGGTFEASVLDILEQSATGRVLVFYSADRRSTNRPCSWPKRSGGAKRCSVRHIGVHSKEGNEKLARH